VYNLSLSSSVSEGVDFVFVKGITYGFTTEQIKEIYGEASDEYVSDDKKYVYLTYEAPGRDYFCNKIEFDFKNNELYEISLTMQPE
jgi:hypothetical protein